MKKISSYIAMQNYFLDDPLLAGYFAEGENKACDSVIILGGSEGRIHKKYADLLAEKGISTLALGYFDSPKISKNLENINLEYFVLAANWLKQNTRSDKVAIIGYSHGAQLALILASYFPDLFSKVICFSPISYLLGGFPYVNKPAWRLEGKSLSHFLKGVASQDLDLTVGDDLKKSVNENKIVFRKNTNNDPFIVKDLFDKMVLENRDDQAEIPCSKIKAAVLLFSGREDAIWNSSFYALQIKEKATSAKKFIHIDYEGVGHGIFESYNGPVYCRLGEFWCHLGGDPLKNDNAEKDAWQKTIAFIKNEFI